MAAPVTFPSLKRALGFAKDVTPGVPVAPVAHMPIATFNWNDKPTWLEDKALRSVMGDDAFNLIQGVGIGEIDMAGPVFGDELGYLLGNLFGTDDTVGASAPFTHKFSLLNTLSGQPTSHTITQYYGPEPTHNARQFSGTAISDLTLSFNAETDMLMFTSKGISWMSNIAAATPTPTFTTAKPLPSWQAILGIGGPASGGTLVASIYKGEFNFQRRLKPYFTAQNLQTPYIIQRGGLTCDFKLTYIAADESALTAMRNNTQPQVQFILSNGLTLGNALVVQVDIQQGAFKVAKPNFGSEAIEFDVEGKAIFNSTNVGTSAGLGPATVSLQNAIAAGTFI
jgi:hypothetical protein